MKPINLQHRKEKGFHVIVSCGIPQEQGQMERSMQKAIEDYRALKAKKGGNFGAFYKPDLDELRKITFDSTGTNFQEIVLVAVWNGLKAGFMIGYRAGLREASKHNRGKAI